MVQPDPLTFPDVPRGRLDEAITELVERAREVLDTQGRLRALLRANHAMVEQLDLPTVLQRIVDAAVELVGATYGAIGVIAPSGGLEQFIHVGMSADAAANIAHLPEGRGILGALIDDPQPIRLHHLGMDPRASGFPENHPPMDSFLGVPIRVGDTVFGNLYLTNQQDGRFSSEDEQLVISLAATAGFAIENARLFADAQRRQAWIAASADVTSVILSTDEDPLGVIANRIRDVSEADLVSIVQPAVDGSGLLVQVARGDGEAAVQGAMQVVEGSCAALVMAGGQPRLFDPQTGTAGTEVRDVTQLVTEEGVGAAMAIPLQADGRMLGALVVARSPGAVRFTRGDLEMAADFAGQVSVAMTLADARADQQRMVLLQERGRIARDLHDHVIQELFGTGLALQSLAGALPPGGNADRLQEAVARLDGTIAQIRTVIFALTTRASTGPATTRHRVLDLISDVSPGLARTPSVAFAGAVDILVTGALAEDVIAAAREALTNIARHAHAHTASLTLAVTGDAIVLEVVDDGVGIAGSRRSGLGNLEERARARGGHLHIDRVKTGGTRLVWTVPLDAGERTE